MIYCAPDCRSDDLTAGLHPDFHAPGPDAGMAAALTASSARSSPPCSKPFIGGHCNTGNVARAIGSFRPCNADPTMPTYSPQTLCLRLHQSGPGLDNMIRLTLGTAMALGFLTSVALAQTTSSQTTTTTDTPVLVAPPSGTLSTTTSKKSVGLDGTMTNSTSTTYGNSNGVASDSRTETTTVPPPVPITTSKSTSTTTVTH